MSLTIKRCTMAIWLNTFWGRNLQDQTKIYALLIVTWSNLNHPTSSLCFLTHLLLKSKHQIILLICSVSLQHCETLWNSFCLPLDIEQQTTNRHSTGYDQNTHCCVCYVGHSRVKCSTWVLPVERKFSIISVSHFISIDI